MLDEAGVQSGGEAAESQSPDAELEAKQQAEAASTEVPVKPEDGEDAAEGADSAEGESEPKGKEAAPDTVEIDGEAVPLETLKEAYSRAQEIQEKHEQVESIKTALKEQPADTLFQIFTAQHGGNKEKGFAALVAMSEQVIAYHLKREELSPHERRAMELEEENKTLKQKEEERRQKEQEAAEAEALEEATASIVEEMTAAFKEAGVADTPRNRQKVASIVSAKWGKGLKKYTVADGVRAAKVALAKEAEERKKEYLASLKPEDLTEEQIQAIRAHNVSKTKSNIAAGSKTADGQESKGGRVFLPKRVSRIV